MATTYRTCDGDVLDTLCLQRYGHLRGTVEAVLAANPRLPDQAEPYRSGILIAFPDLAPAESAVIQLWS
ncbi:tail protein X [Chitiniphilus eburneus]|uniref:tail protein X n=1 Tax=Chitiniphilus eburneus TaxID=2571148 RepID=UPI0035CF6A42